MDVDYTYIKQLVDEMIAKGYEVGCMGRFYDDRRKAMIVEIELRSTEQSKLFDLEKKCEFLEQELEDQRHLATIHAQAWSNLIAEKKKLEEELKARK
jgi:hypothetical protein